MYEIVLSCDDLERHEQMAVTSQLLNARMGMWIQLHQIMRALGDDIEARETVWLDPDGALCEGVEWVQRHPDGTWSSMFRLYVRERPDDDVM